MPAYCSSVLPQIPEIVYVDDTKHGAAGLFEAVLGEPEVRAAGSLARVSALQGGCGG